MSTENKGWLYIPIKKIPKTLWAYLIKLRTDIPVRYIDINTSVLFMSAKDGVLIFGCWDISLIDSDDSMLSVADLEQLLVVYSINQDEAYTYVSKLYENRNLQ